MYVPDCSYHMIENADTYVCKVICCGAIRDIGYRWVCAIKGPGYDTKYSMRRKRLVRKPPRSPRDAHPTSKIHQPSMSFVAIELRFLIRIICEFFRAIYVSL